MMVRKREYYNTWREAVDISRSCDDVLYMPNCGYYVVKHNPYFAPITRVILRNPLTTVTLGVMLFISWQFIKIQYLPTTFVGLTLAIMSIAVAYTMLEELW